MNAKIISLFLVAVISSGIWWSNSDIDTEYQSPPGTLLSWESKWITSKYIHRTNSVIDSIEAGRLFQYFSSEIDLAGSDMREFMSSMSKKDVVVYYLCGEPDWIGKYGLNKIKKEINRVVSYNNKAATSRRFAGITLDVEPYILDNWGKDSAELMQQLYDTLEKSYQYASKKGLKVTICIPYWYDEKHAEALESLISDCCDEVAVMNYWRGKEQKNLSMELNLAKQYDKDIMTIFEFQKPGKHGLSDNNTYYNYGNTAAKLVYEELCEAMDYDRLVMGYHDAGIMYKLLDE